MRRGSATLESGSSGVWALWLLVSVARPPPAAAGMQELEVGG